MNIFSLYSYAFRTALGVVTAVCVIGSSDAAVDQSDHVLNGPTLFSAEAGTTNVYSGVISGTGPAIIEGGGTVAFSNPNNSYIGGTIVSNAVFRLDADGCAGASTITAAVSTAHIYMNCANVANDLYFAGNYNQSTQPTTAVLGYYPSAGVHPLFPLVPSVTVSGKVYFKENARFLPGSQNITATVTFANDVETANGKVLHIYTYGTTIFNGRLKSGAASNHSPIGGASSAKGNIEFNCTSNVLWSFQSYNANVALNAPDALPEAMIYFSHGSSGCAKFDLDGNSQTFSSILWNNGDKGPSVKSNDSGYCFNTGDDKPATVRLTGSETYKSSENAYKNKLALFGPITLVMDVPSKSTAEGVYQEFTLRKSTTIGDLVISNGDFRVSGGATFKNVPNIYVGEGGMFSSAATTNAFVGCTNLIVKGILTFADDVVNPFGTRTMSLSLGAAARLSLPSDATVMVCALEVDGVKMPDGKYGSGGTALDQIVQGTVVVRSSGDYYVDCSNGDDSYDGTAAKPLKTIYAATQRILKGNTIYVAPGVYGEAEGSQKATASSKIGTRVIIPAGVMIESTEGPEKTFIIGAAATGDQIDNEKYSTGTNAVRCVYANDGAVLRGFTLTGGRGIGVVAGNGGDWTVDCSGAAFRCATDAKATIEYCIVSNNAAYVGTIYNNSIVRNCRVIGNTATRGQNYGSGSAGRSCSWYGCVISDNLGNGTLLEPVLVESCTFGTNKMYAGGTAQLLSTSKSAGHRRVVNSLFLYNGDRWNGWVFATNCIFAVKSGDHSALNVTNCGNCVFGKSPTAVGIGADYRLLPGSIAIDAGDNALVSGEIEGAKDMYGTPRVLNAKVDVGATEYDWRPTFADRIGKRLVLTDVSPFVTTNAVGGISISSGTVAGTVPLKGFYDFTFDVSGGTLELFLGSESEGTYTDGTHTVRVNVLNPADEFRFAFLADAENPGAAIIKSVLPVHGLVISVR